MVDGRLLELWGLFVIIAKLFLTGTQSIVIERRDAEKCAAFEILKVTRACKCRADYTSGMRMHSISHAYTSNASGMFSTYSVYVSALLNEV